MSMASLVWDAIDALKGNDSLEDHQVQAAIEHVSAAAQKNIFRDLVSGGDEKPFGCKLTTSDLLTMA